MNLTIPLSELIHSTFADRDLAEEAAPDCLRLFAAEGQDFETVRAQKWYKRLWLFLVEGGTRVQAEQCRSLAEAQDLLARILETHFERTARTSLLTTLVAEGLAGHAGPIPQRILALGAERERLLRELEHGAYDPSNEYTWPEEHRLLLFQVMAVAATADGQLADEERKLLSFKLRDLDLGAEARAEAERYLDRVVPLRGEVRRLEDPRMRMVLFRHAAAVVLADGKYTVSEKRCIQDLARALSLPAEEAEAVFSELSPVGPRLAPERVAALTSLGRKVQHEAPPAEEPASADPPAEVEAALAGLAPFLRAWMREFTAYTHKHLADFITRRGEEINLAFQDGTRLDRGLDLYEQVFEVEALRRDLHTSLEESRSTYRGACALLGDRAGLRLDESLSALLDESFRTLEESGGEAGAAVGELLRTVRDVRAHVPANVLASVEAGALGSTSLLLLGTRLDPDLVGRRLESLVRAEEQVWEAAARWNEEAAPTLDFLGERLVESLTEGLRARSCVRSVRRAQEALQAELMEWAAEAEVPV